MLEVAFVGRINNDLTERTTKTGKPWLGFNVTVQDGTTREFLSVAVFDAELLDALGGRLKRGTPVYGEGRLRLHQWEDSDGDTRGTLQVTASALQVLGEIGKRRREKARGQGVADAADYQRPLDDAGSNARSPVAAGVTLPAHMQEIPF